MNKCGRFQVKSKKKLWGIQQKGRWPYQRVHLWSCFAQKSLRNRSPKILRSELKASGLLLSAYGIDFVPLRTYFFSIRRGSIEWYLRAETLKLYFLESVPRFKLLLLYFYWISWMLSRDNARLPSFWEHCQITFPYLFQCKWGMLLVLTNNIRVEMKCDISSPRFIRASAPSCLV